MDHLPTPIDGERPVVHFYAHHRPYSPNDFYRIPHEYEYDDFEDLLENGLREGMDPSDASQFLQSWLFFGLLSIFLGKDINCEDFAGNIGENLNDFPQVEDESQIINPTLMLSSNSVHEALDPLLTLSIASLGELLQEELWKHLSHLDKEHPKLFWNSSVEGERLWGAKIQVINIINEGKTPFVKWTDHEQLELIPIDLEDDKSLPPPGEWSTRLWTLPEAVLAKNLYVAFRDDYLSTEQIAEARDKAKNDPNDRHHFIWKAGHPFSPAIWHLRQWHLSKRDHRQKCAFPVQRSWQEIQFRYCSKESDETIVLSAILGLDNSKLLDIGPHQHKADEIGSRRMKSFLDSLDSTSMHKWFKVHAAIADEDWIEFWTSEHSREMGAGTTRINAGSIASGQVRRVKTMCRVWVRLESNTNIIKKLKKEFREKPEGKMIGSKVRDQQWCVE
ncbi:hypothetical protein SCUP234_11436 [Seiridium cupressi]